MVQADRRGFHRIPIRVPVFIKGKDIGGEEFYELTYTLNVSASGACFSSQRQLQTFTDLLVSIPAPVDTSETASEDYEFKFPAKIIRIENGPTMSKKRVAVRFAKLIHGD
jgi:hypothetical protein